MCTVYNCHDHVFGSVLEYIQLQVPIQHPIIILHTVETERLASYISFAAVKLYAGSYES